MFSLDVVGVVAGYDVCGVATAGATPSHLFAFGAEGEGGGQFKGGCCSFACSSDGKLFVGDGRGCQMFSSEGKFIDHVANGKFTSSCLGIASDNNGEIFLADTGGDRILVCRMDGSFVRSFGSKGSCNGQLKSQRGLVVDGNGLLFVVDYGNHRVQVLRRDGSFVRAFGSYGSGDGQLNYPFGVAVSDSAEVFVTDQYNHRVQVIGLFLLRIRRCVAGVRRQRKVPTQVRQKRIRTRTISEHPRHRIGRRWQCFRWRLQQPPRANFQVRRHVRHHVRLTRQR